MSPANVCFRAAIEPPAKLDGLRGRDSALYLAEPGAGICALADSSGSWGLGASAASRTLGLLRTSLRPDSSFETRALELEHAALESEQALATDDADTLFSAALLQVRDNRISCAWAGDLLAAVCDGDRVHWINHPNHRSAAKAPPGTSARPVSWFPGLLGCSRAQRGAGLLERAPETQLAASELLLVLSEAVWSQLDPRMIEDVIRRERDRAEGWQGRAHEAVLRVAKQRGSKGHRAVASLWLGESQAPSFSRKDGYRGLVVQSAGETEWVVEEYESDRELLHVHSLVARDGVLHVEYSAVTTELNRATQQALIGELVLEELLLSRFRAEVQRVIFRERKQPRSSERAYAELESQWHEG